MGLAALLFTGFSLFLGADGIEISYPEIEPARPIEYVSVLEARPEVVEGYWSGVDLNPYHIPVEEIAERTLFRLGDSLCFPYARRIFSHYGVRHSRFHEGVDIPLHPGTEVHAAFAGVVRMSIYHRGYGNIVIIRHPNGLETAYAHMSRRNVYPGDEVKAGDVIGLSGSTGRSTGPHLHFETTYCGRHFDPELIIDCENGTLRKTSFILRRDNLR